MTRSSIWHALFHVDKTERVNEIVDNEKVKEDDRTLDLGELLRKYKDLRPLAYELMIDGKLAANVKVIKYDCGEEKDLCKIDQSYVLVDIIRCCKEVEEIEFFEGNVITNWHEALEDHSKLKKFTLLQGKYSPNKKSVMFPQLFRALTKCADIEEIVIDAVHNAEHTLEQSREFIPSDNCTARRCKRLWKFHVGHAYMLPRDLKYLIDLEAPLSDVDLSLSGKVPASEFKAEIDKALDSVWKKYITQIHINHGDTSGFKEESGALKSSDLSVPMEIVVHVQLSNRSSLPSYQWK